MPRMNRLHVPGSLVYIMAQAIENRNLFNDDNDRLEFFNRLKKGLKTSGYKLLGWSLADTRYHLLLSMNDNPPSLLMRSLNCGYARWYNKRNNRRGYLFQDRYKSVLCQEKGNYVTEMIRYIHLDCVNSGRLKRYEDLTSWKWSSHNIVIGEDGTIDAGIVNRSVLLRYISENGKDALSEYEKYLRLAISDLDLKKTGGLPQSDYTEIVGSQKGWPAVIGDQCYVSRAFELHQIGVYRLHRKADYLQVLQKLALEASTKYSISLNDLKKRGRKNARSEARSYFCNRSHVNEKIPLTEIANYLVICISPVAKHVQKGELIVKREEIKDLQKSRGSELMHSQ